MSHAPQSIRYRNNASFKRRARVVDNVDSKDAPEIWGDGDRFFRLDLLSSHMLKKNIDTIGISDAASVMQLHKNTYEAKRLLRSCTKKFEELSSNEFKILTVPKEKIETLIEYMKNHNIVEIQIRSASTIMKYSFGMAYKLIKNSDEFEKSDRRGYYKFKGVKIDRVKPPKKVKLTR